MSTFFKLCLAIGVVVGTATMAPAQYNASQARTAPPVPPQIPLSHLYFQLLMHEAHLQHVEQQHPEAAKSKKTFEDVLRERTSLTQQEWKVLQASSLRFESTHKSLMAERITLLKAACPQAEGTCQQAKPALATLQSRHEQALENEISTIESALSIQSVSTLHSFLQDSLAPTIRIVTPEQAAAATQTTAAVQK